MSADYLVISTSLNPASRSRLLAREAFQTLLKDVTAEWLDLCDYDLPLCDGAEAYSAPGVAQVTEEIARAKCILMGIPIYNYASSSSAKNLIELTGKAWAGKVVGFMCAAGGRASYMSVMSLANSLMLDFRCVIIPRFVYADKSQFSDSDIFDKGVQERIKELCETAVKFSKLV